jgi:hypothetical protein
MKLEITAPASSTNHYLIVRSDGVHYCESTFEHSRRFRFDDIVCILLSPDNRLSFQVGDEVYSIPTDAANPDHQAVIDSLVAEVRHAGGGDGETG